MLIRLAAGRQETLTDDGTAFHLVSNKAANAARAPRQLPGAENTTKVKAPRFKFFFFCT